MSSDISIAVVGGGIAGSTITLYLSSLGLDVTLFEKKETLVDGPPVCHLHAGGNLYREISDEQCITLLKESIDLIRFYPHSIDRRPTLVVVPLSDKGDPIDIIPRLQLLKAQYIKIIAEDEENELLGSPDNYFKLYSKDKVMAIKERETVANPSTFDEWMIPACRHMDLDKLKFPLLMVNEYGLNIFRLGATVTLCLDECNNCKVKTNSTVKSLKKETKSGKWIVQYKDKDKKHKKEEFDYLINSAGFETGSIDDMLSFKRDRFVEFKAAYVAKWNKQQERWPEVIFHGTRGTPDGMAQFTPYPDGYFQLHGMTKCITLFEDGLVSSKDNSSQPSLPASFINKIEEGWSKRESDERSGRSVSLLAKYIPSFSSASIGFKPLYGAQQIPGLDAELRTANVTFEREGYARCEIVKASSVLSMADAITKNLIDKGHIDKSNYGKRAFHQLQGLKESNVQKKAMELSSKRGYPSSLGKIIN